MKVYAVMNGSTILEPLHRSFERAAQQMCAIADREKCLELLHVEPLELDNATVTHERQRSGDV